jgi:hypothetical protein
MIANIRKISLEMRRVYFSHVFCMNYMQIGRQGIYAAVRVTLHVYVPARPLLSKQGSDRRNVPF